jgi:hypothetical protein
VHRKQCRNTGTARAQASGVAKSSAFGQLAVKRIITLFPLVVFQGITGRAARD